MMKIRFLLILTVAFLFAVSAAPVFAQGAMNGVVTVDMLRIERDSAASKSIRGQLEKYRTADQQELTKQENELRKIEQELGQQRALISPEAFAERRRQFEQKVNNLQRDAQSRKREFDKVQVNASRTVETALRQIIEQMVKERKLVLVLSKAQTMYSAPELEITDEVLKRLDAKLPSVKVPPPAKTPPPAKAPPPSK